MIDTRTSRLLAVTLLLAALAVALIGFGTLTPNPEAGRYPSEGDLGQSPERYVGDLVQINGPVVGTDPVVIEPSYTTVRDGSVVRGTLAVTVTGVETPLERSDVVQVFGTLTDAGSIQADAAVAKPPYQFLVMYLVSFVAGLWVLARLVRRWRVDWSRFGLEPRSRPLGGPRPVRSRLVTTAEDDDA